MWFWLAWLLYMCNVLEGTFIRLDFNLDKLEEEILDEQFSVLVVINSEMFSADIGDVFSFKIRFSILVN